MRMMGSVFQVEINLAGHPLFIAPGEQCREKSRPRHRLQLIRTSRRKQPFNVIQSANTALPSPGAHP